MNNIVWLQLADWHHGAWDKADRELILKKLKKDILERHKIDQMLGTIDFAVFCGDLANKASKTEYSQCAKSFLSVVALAAGLKPIGKKYKNIFIVPGNHDIDRGYIEKYSPSSLKVPLTTTTEINSWVAQDTDRQFILAPFQAYLVGPEKAPSF